MNTPEVTYHGVRLVSGSESRAIAFARRVGRCDPLGDGGFEWGYLGGGPSRLAYAILLHATGGRHAVAYGLYADYMREVVQYFGDSWETTADEVRAWVGQALRRDSRPADPPIRVQQSTDTVTRKGGAK